MTKLIALDPGGTTGVAVVEMLEDGKLSFNVAQIGPAEHHVELEDFLHKQLEGVSRRWVICERFDYRNTSKSGLRLDSREYIGTVKGYCRRQGIPLVLQTAAQAKGFVSNNILKELNLYTEAFRHANDAMRHLIYFVVNNEDFKFKALPYELNLRKSLLDLGFK